MDIVTMIVVLLLTALAVAAIVWMELSSRNAVREKESNEALGESNKN